MRQRISGRTAATLAAGAMTAMALVLSAPAYAQEGDVPSQAELWRIVQQQQKEIEELKAMLAAGGKPAPAAISAAPAMQSKPADAERLERLEQRVAATEQGLEATASALDKDSAASGSSWWERTSLGGYGSLRFESSNLDGHNDGFTFRRFVLAVDSQITDRLQTYLELEFERFTELELEKGVEVDGDELELEQALEGSNGSEISIEQAWARYKVNPALNFDFGALLVPVGRFNINHDDNQWVLPRRTLVDRGAPVLPSKAAWPELGAGVSGLVELGGGALLDYRLYAVNGAAVDFELETVLKAALEDSGDTELESKLEAKFGPSRGPFSENANKSLALTGRAALRPAPGQEIAFSGYIGNYVPSYLGRSDNVWSVGVDGFHRLGGIEIEYEAVTTRFENVGEVAAAFASTALSKERAIEGPVEGGAFAKHEIESTLSKNVMAKQKTGYWVEVRYPFWPSVLDDTVLGRGFDDPKLIPALRMEQVFYNDQLTGIDFDGGIVTSLRTRDAHLNRATFGLGYQPTPAWVLQVAGEYTWTNEDSLAGLTNFLAAGPEDDDAMSLLLGVAFGF